MLTSTWPKEDHHNCDSVTMHILYNFAHLPQDGSWSTGSTVQYRTTKWSSTHARRDDPNLGL